MAVFIEVLAWIVIAYAAVPIVLTLLSLGGGFHARNQRHGRVATVGEAWPDIRPFLPCVAIGVSLLGYQRLPGTASWWLTQIPLLAAVAAYLAAWLWLGLRGKAATPAAEREIRGYLLAFAAVTSLLTYQWTAGTAGWWLMHIPVFAAGAVCLEAALRYLIRRKQRRSSAESS